MVEHLKFKNVLGHASKAISGTGGKLVQLVQFEREAHVGICRC